jgi:hypothetical protein
MATKKIITQSQFEKLWNTFEGRNKEFADLLNKKNFVTATGKKFTDRNVSEYVGYYGLKRKTRGGKIFPTTQKKLDKLDKLIVEANNSYKRTPNIGELVKKSGFVKSGKISDMSKTGPGQSLVREKLKKLLTTNQKMENYINNVMLSEDALVKDFYSPAAHLRKKFNISTVPFAEFAAKSKAIANNRELFLNLGRVQSFNKYGFNPDGSSRTVSEFSEIITNRVPFSAGHGALREDNATSQILKSAIRNYEKSKAAGKTPKVTFITDPAITPTKDLQFIDNKTGRLFSIDPSVEKVEFRGKNYKNNYLNNVNASKLYAKEFGNVYKIYDNDIPKYMAATISDGKGGQIKLDTALRRKLFDRTGSKNYLVRRAVEFDHLDIVDDPFGRKPGNVRLIDRLTNVQAGGVKQAGDVARGKNPQLLKKRLDNIGYNIKDKNVEGLITRLSDNYKKPLKFISPRTEQNILKRKEQLAKSLFDSVDKAPQACRAILDYSTGGISKTCAAAIRQDPVGAATKLEEIKPTSAALGKVRNAASAFLKFAGKGKTFAVTAGVGVGAGALVKKFMNDDPSTYLTDDKQANAMILDTIDQKERQERMDAIGDAPELLDEANIAANIAVTAAPIPGASAVYAARRKPFTRIVDGVAKTRKAMGPARAALGPVGKALSGFATPAGIAALTPLNVASSLYEGDSAYEIATDPVNYLGPALAGNLSKEATRGMGATSKLARSLRLGMSPGAIKMVSRRFGLPGLALSAGISLYELADDYKSSRGIFGKKE